MTDFETDLLSGLIHQKYDCLTQLRDMGRKQLELVRDGSMSDLLDLLSAKQRVLLEVQRIERQLDPFRNQDPDKRPWPSSDARQRCAQELAQCELLLGEIVVQEKQSEQALIRRRDETAAQLQGVHLASQARGAYTSAVHEGYRQLDLTSDS
jgi:hypothetical protein